MTLLDIFYTLLPAHFIGNCRVCIVHIVLVKILYFLTVMKSSFDVDMNSMFVGRCPNWIGQLAVNEKFPWDDDDDFSYL